MDLQHRVTAFLDAHDGVITATEAARLGATANGLRSLVRAGVLQRVARGAYISSATAAELKHEQRHRLAVIAVVRVRPDSLAASHQSAAALYGLPVMRADLDRVHVMHRRVTPQTRRHDTFTVHRCPSKDSFRVFEGHPVVVPELAVLGTATLAGVRSGIAAADRALRAELTTKTQLRQSLERMRHTPGLAAARYVVEHASRTAESPGESLTRLLLIEQGLRFVPQKQVKNVGGQVIACVDFYLPDLDVVVEFDGMVKYEGLHGIELAREKRREDRIRRLGYGVARLIWADLFNPAQVATAICEAAETASRPRAS